MYFLRGLKGIVQRKLRWVENWYPSADIAQLLGRWTFFFYFKGQASWILQKMFCRHLSPDY
jgi:hypothetical protein